MLRKGRQQVENARMREMEAILRGDFIYRDHNGKFEGAMPQAQLDEIRERFALQPAMWSKPPK